MPDRVAHLWNLREIITVKIGCCFLSKDSNGFLLSIVQWSDNIQNIDGFVKLIWFSYALQNWSFFCEKNHQYRALSCLIIPPL